MGNAKDKNIPYPIGCFRKKCMILYSFILLLLHLGLKTKLVYLSTHEII